MSMITCISLLLSKGSIFTVTSFSGTSVMAISRRPATPASASRLFFALSRNGATIFSYRG